MATLPYGFLEGTGFEQLDSRFKGCIPGPERVQRLWTGARWCEGPAWFAAHRTLVWSDIPNNRMLRFDEVNGTVGTFREPSDNTNGNTVDRQGRLVSCEHLTRRVTRTEHDGTITVLASHWNGKRLNSPNDVVVHSDGAVWFTDPSYGILSDYEGLKAESEIGACHVYRIDPQSGEVERMADDFVKPNGLAFSPDERILYVSDTSAALRTDGSGNHHIVAFDVIGGQDLASPRVFAVVNPGLADGFRVDVHGFVYTSSADSVQVYHPDGTRLARIAVPEKVGNLTFGGTDGNELFVCASTSLYRIRLNTSGAVRA